MTVTNTRGTKKERAVRQKHLDANKHITRHFNDVYVAFGSIAPRLKDQDDIKRLKIDEEKLKWFQHCADAIVLLHVQRVIDDKTRNHAQRTLANLLGKARRDLEGFQ